MTTCETSQLSSPPTSIQYINILNVDVLGELSREGKKNLLQARGEKKNMILRDNTYQS